MIKKVSSALIWSFTAVFCILILSFDSAAAGGSALEASELHGYRLGPGDHMDDRGNIVSLDGTVVVDSEGNVLQPNTIAIHSGKVGVISDSPVEDEADEGLNYVVDDSGDEIIYKFDGKSYTLGESYGVHRLTGYSPSDTGTAMTVSGEEAKARYTVAAPEELPLGTVLLIMGESGPNSSDYDGMYVVQDRGGSVIEDNKLLDIYFDTYEEAMHVTDMGWNYVEVFIAVPVD